MGLPGAPALPGWAFPLPEAVGGAGLRESLGINTGTVTLPGSFRKWKRNQVWCGQQTCAGNFLGDEAADDVGWP